MTTLIAEGPVDRRVEHQVTDPMIDSFIAFADKTMHLHHPDVPYYGTVNGDSEEAWRRRVVKAALTAALMPNAKVRGPEAALSPETPSRLTGSAAAGNEAP